MYIKMSWIFLILSVPIVGIPCYFFSEDRSLRRRHRKEWQELWKHMRRLGPENELLNETLRQTRYGCIQTKQAYHSKSEISTVCGGTAQSTLNQVKEAFESILKDLRSAEKFIFMEYFIISSGVMLDQILDILKEKVKHGVVVRIIYDDFGSINAIPPHFIKEMESIGIQTRRFNPYKPMLSSNYE